MWSEVSTISHADDTQTYFRLSLVGSAQRHQWQPEIRLRLQVKYENCRNSPRLYTLSLQVFFCLLFEAEICFKKFKMPSLVVHRSISKQIVKTAVKGVNKKKFAIRGTSRSLWDGNRDTLSPCAVCIAPRNRCCGNACFGEQVNSKYGTWVIGSFCNSCALAFALALHIWWVLKTTKQLSTRTAAILLDRHFFSKRLSRSTA